MSQPLDEMSGEELVFDLLETVYRILLTGELAVLLVVLLMVFGVIR